MMNVYNCNTSQTAYRIVIDEYEYSASDTQSEAQMTAALIADFNSGNVPDILYGNNFDYDYLASAGLLLNLTDYIDNKALCDCDTLDDAAANLLRANGNSYYIFPAYSLSGYICRQEDAEELCDTTFVEFYGTDSSARPVTYGEFASDIAVNILAYDKDSSSLSQDTSLTIVETALANGTTGLNDSDLLAGEEYFLSGDATAFFGGMGNFENYVYQCESSGSSLSFIGRPGINRCLHTISPTIITAVMSDSDNSDFAIDFLSGLFSEDIQQRLYDGGNIPVLSSVNDMAYTSYSITAGSDCHGELIEEYKAALSSIDTVCMYDFGLMSIISDEIDSHALTGKTAEEIAESLTSRVKLYYQERF